LRIQPSGFYAWQKSPRSERARDDARQTELIRQAWNDSGNCRDNAVAETFFSSLKRERIRRRTYKTREEARQDVFDSIEMFSPLRANGSGVGCYRPSNFNDSGF